MWKCRQRMVRLALGVSLGWALVGCGRTHGREELDAHGDAGVADVSLARDAPDARASLDAPDTCGVPEACDGRDDDCDGHVDEAVLCELPHAASACARGECAVSSCVEGFADCNGASPDGCEVATSGDRQNCGACGVSCGVTEACVEGRCERERIVDFSVGNGVLVALESGRTVGWGPNMLGDLGISSTVHPVVAPVELTELPPVVEVEHGAMSGCARTAAGAVYCWGDSSIGTAGTGVIGTHQPVQRVPLPGPVAELRAGVSWMCARGADYGPHCWGRWMSWEEPQPSPAPWALVGDYPFFLGWYSVHVDVGGRLMAAGYSIDRSLGVQELPHGEAYVPDLRDVPVYGAIEDVQTGRFHGCALVAAEVLSWGGDELGQLGDGTPAVYRSPPEIEPPRRVEGLAAVASISLGAESSCALEVDGDVLCWGAGRENGLGVDVASPTLVLSGVSRLEGFGDRRCAQVGESSLRCWGPFNTDSSAGDGSPGDRPIPVSPIGFE